jgi:hypothetical protein
MVKREFFEGNSFLVVKDFFSEEEAKSLRQWAEKMGAYSRKYDKATVFL